MVTVACLLATLGVMSTYAVAASAMLLVPGVLLIRYSGRGRYTTDKENARQDRRAELS